MKLVLGLLAGGLYSWLDGYILWKLLCKAEKHPEKSQGYLSRGLVARGLLTVGVVGLGAVVPFVDAAGMVIALLVQKGVLVWLVLHRWKKEKYFH